MVANPYAGVNFSFQDIDFIQKQNLGGGAAIRLQACGVLWEEYRLFELV